MQTEKKNENSTFTEDDCKMVTGIVALVVFVVTALYLSKQQEVGELCGNALWVMTLISLCLHIIALCIFLFGPLCLTEKFIAEVSSAFIIFSLLVAEAVVFYMEINKTDCMKLISNGSNSSTYHALLMAATGFFIFVDVISCLAVIITYACNKTQK